MSSDFSEDEFSRFIYESSYESQAELVGLTILYHEERIGVDATTSAEVRTFLEQSRISVNLDAVPARISDLEDTEHLTRVESSSSPHSYRLTFEGLDRFQEIAADIDGIAIVRDDSFLDTGEIHEEYYSRLVEDINKCYRYGINDGCLVLTRKLFENLVIDTLRAEYGGPGIDLYYNTDNGRFHGLGTLCGKLREKSSDLGHYSRQLDNGLVNRIEQFKERGNSQAHSVRVDIHDDELEGMSNEATELANILYDIREEIRIANG
jgi:hypothetical protein